MPLTWPDWPSKEVIVSLLNRTHPSAAAFIQSNGEGPAVPVVAALSIGARM